MNDKFNIRVYGILIDRENELLVTDEYRFGKFITKFPGGGLQFGEGTLDCLRREMLEETGNEIEVISHFYTTDFFQHSAFSEAQQIISIYYRMRTLQPLTIQIHQLPFDFGSLQDGAQVFRRIPLRQLRKDDFTFPIDQKVAGMLMQNII